MHDGRETTRRAVAHPVSPCRTAMLRHGNAIGPGIAAFR